MPPRLPCSRAEGRAIRKLDHAKVASIPQPRKNGKSRNSFLHFFAKTTCEIKDTIKLNVVSVVAIKLRKILLQRCNVPACPLRVVLKRCKHIRLAETDGSMHDYGCSSTDKNAARNCDT